MVTKEKNLTYWVACHICNLLQTHWDCSKTVKEWNGQSFLTILLIWIFHKTVEILNEAAAFRQPVPVNSSAQKNGTLFQGDTKLSIWGLLWCSPSPAVFSSKLFLLLCTHGLSSRCWNLAIQIILYSLHKLATRISHVEPPTLKTRMSLNHVRTKSHTICAICLWVSLENTFCFNMILSRVFLWRAATLKNFCHTFHYKLYLHWSLF